MSALDTNVLVRWLMDDDAAQCAAVVSLREEALAAEEQLLVPVTVMLELEWVLRSRFGLDRAAITEALDALMSIPELAIHEEPAMERALMLFKQDGAPDFADCLHIGLTAHVGQAPLLTFDKRAARLDGAGLLR